jgi:hypothetical protein
MSLPSKDILAVALALPEGERLDLAAALLAASEPPTPELAGEPWLAEIDRRSTMHPEAPPRCDEHHR